MGVVGGLVPSPSALVVLLAATAAGRAWFGVVMVVAFGLGMAASLAAVGLVARGLLLRVETLALRRGLLASSVRRVTSYGAATGVATIGILLAARAASALT